MDRQIISTFLVICGLCVVCCYLYQIRLHQGFFPVPRFSESGRDRFFFFFGGLFHLYNLFFLVSLSLDCSWTGAKGIYKIRLARFLLYVDCIFCRCPRIVMYLM